ncbi:MAG: apolipoprotein N-acyltransferase [Acidimicrobiia bacterium]
MRGTLGRYGAAVGSGILLALARPPADFGLLALIALVPLFVAWRDTSVRRHAALAFVAGCAYYVGLVSWTWYFGAVAIVPLVALLAAYWAATGAVIGWFASRGFRSPWLTAALWILFEYVMARAPLEGFSWGEVGYAFHDVGIARDLASVGGLPLLSFLAVAINALLADLVRRGPQAQLTRTDTLRALAGVVAVMVGAGVVLAVRPDITPTGELRVAILQGNDKNRDLTAAEKDARYLPTSHFELAAQVQDPVDLIIFPESSMDADPRIDPELARQLAAVAREHDAWVLTNAVVDAPDGRAVNLNLLYGPDGELQDTYAKRHLVPYGEYVKFRDQLEWTGAPDEIPRDFMPGDRSGVFEIAGHEVATVICFESAFGYEIRPLVADEGAETIVVSTNNRSYRRSANSAQHVALGQIRAAETGRPVVHAAISGISALIDSDGRVLARTELFERTVLQGAVITTTGETLYVRFGDWIILVALLGVAGCLGTAAWLRRRSRSVDSDTESEPVAALAPTGDRG